MQKLYGLAEKLVLYFACNNEIFNDIPRISQNGFFEMLAKNNFDVTGYISLETWDALKSLKVKGFVCFSVIQYACEAYCFRINNDMCMEYLEQYKRDNSRNGKIINHISKNSWFYGSLFGALSGLLFTVIIEKIAAAVL